MRRARRARRARVRVCVRRVRRARRVRRVRRVRPPFGASSLKMRTILERELCFLETTFPIFPVFLRPGTPKSEPLRTPLGSFGLPLCLSWASLGLALCVHSGLAWLGPLSQ